MIGYHTLGYILYNYDYITVYVSCVDIFLDLSANISRYFLGILQTKRAVATPSVIADAMTPPSMREAFTAYRYAKAPSERELARRSRD